MKRKVRSCASEGLPALLFFAKDDVIPSLLVINPITTAYVAYLKLLLSGGFQTQNGLLGGTIMSGTRVLDVFV